jgi:hypothetical protein
MQVSYAHPSELIRANCRLTAVPTKKKNLSADMHWIWIRDQTSASVRMNLISFRKVYSRT